MFLATILICMTQEATSCELYYNTETVFVTEAACEQDTTEAKDYLLTLNPAFIETACIALPGGSA
jgi:hypothetical protein